MAFPGYFCFHDVDDDKATRWKEFVRQLSMMEFNSSMTMVCPQGLQLREAFHVVKLARDCPAVITLEHDGFCADGKSLWGILQLGVMPGGRVMIRADGDGAAEGLARLQGLFDLPGVSLFRAEPQALA